MIKLKPYGTVESMPGGDDIYRRLCLPSSQSTLPLVIDTDTYNEVDDQFALCYALASPERLDVKAVYAAPFHNNRSSGPADGMEKSYDEILRLLDKLGRSHEGFVYKGSEQYLPDEQTPVPSPAALDLVERSKAYTSENPLYVAAIGAITNIASALLMDPKLKERIVVVWLGGHPLWARDTREFNLVQDIPAARVVFDSGVPLVLVPCMGVASHMLTTVPELSACLTGKNPVCDALFSLFCSYREDHFGWAKEIWDVAPIGFLINPDWAPSLLEHSPIVTDQGTWSRDSSRHMIRVVESVNRNKIFQDMFLKLSKL